jgi:Ca2+-binding RTX toxin-like protein
MPTQSDIVNTPLSNLQHIDALLSWGPHWNYLTPIGNVMTYTFSISSGNEVSEGTPVVGQQAFTLSQQQATRTAMEYISTLTGIVFTETAVGENAHVHFANIDIEPTDAAGQFSWNGEYSYHSDTGELSSYSANAYVYLDNNEFGALNADLAPGTWGYQLLLHELGHMLGLKHPFDDDITLPTEQDNTAYTLMSYTDGKGPYEQFNRYDVGALNWLYGGDGLRGEIGINSAGARYISGSTEGDSLTGTQFNDVFRGDKGNDTIFGGEGIDTAVFEGNRSSYNIFELNDGQLFISGRDGADVLGSIELFKFDDGTFQRSELIPVQPRYVGGTSGDDTLYPTDGDNRIDGSDGNDTVVFSGIRAGYDITKSRAGYVVTAKGGGGNGGKDELINVETLQFSDGSLSVAYEEVVQSLYVAYFGRAADPDGMANFQSQLAGLNAMPYFYSVSEAYRSDPGIRALIDSFGNSAESTALYSQGNTTSFVTAIYRNVLSREPDAGGLQFWVDAINNGGLARTNASMSIMSGALFNQTEQGQLDAALVRRKTSIASDFTFAIDTQAEFEGYKGDAAAATVRSMLASVTATTDTALFQATIKSVLDSLDGPEPLNGTVGGVGYAMRVSGAMDAGIMLVGVPRVDEVSLLA